MKNGQQHKNRKSRLTYDETIDLFLRIEAGDMRAREIVVATNSGLVYTAAKRYSWASDRSQAIDFSDLMQDGYEGLLKAIEKFDWREGYAFSTCATQWIRSAIGATVYKRVDTMRLPVQLNRVRPRVHKVIDRLFVQLQRPPQPQEIAQEAKVDVEDVEVIMAFDSLALASLDNVAGDQTEELLVNLVIDHKAATPLGCLLQTLVKERILQMVNELEPVTRMIVSLRCNFEDNKVWLLREIADTLNLTEDRTIKLMYEGFEYLEAYHGAELKEFQGFDFGPVDDLSLAT